MGALLIVSGLLLLGWAAGVVDFDDLFSRSTSSDEDDSDGPIFGTDGHDRWDLSDQVEEVYTGPGQDVISLHGGDDIAFGGEDDDEIYGGSGNDGIFGEGDDDSLFGEQGNDFIDGGLGDDYINGGRGDDILLGFTGDDTISGRIGNDTIVGGWGRDHLYGGSGTDILIGYEDSRNDEFYENADRVDPDSIWGGSGTDYILAGSGDFIDGGEGADVLTLGSWIDPNSPVEVDGYVEGEDVIVILIPDDYAGAAQVSVTPHSSGSHSGTIYLDGTRLAMVAGNQQQGQLLASDIVVERVENFA